MKEDEKGGFEYNKTKYYWHIGDFLNIYGTNTKNRYSNGWSRHPLEASHLEYPKATAQRGWQIGARPRLGYFSQLARSKQYRTHQCGWLLRWPNREAYQRELPAHQIPLRLTGGPARPISRHLPGSPVSGRTDAGGFCRYAHRNRLIMHSRWIDRSHYLG